MTNGERIQTILDVDRDCTEVHGENGTMTFTVTQDFWNAEYKEPTTKNDLGVDCISRDDVRDVMQELWGTSGELMDRLMALPSVTPQYSSGLEKNSKKLEKDFGELDCISRADAIHAVSEALKHTFVEYENIANKVIGKLPSVTPQWTPVSKESPTEFNRVICCTDEDEIFFATYLGKLDGSDCFDDEEGMMWEGDVIAWMSIPEPYRKEK